MQQLTLEQQELLASKGAEPQVPSPQEQELLKLHNAQQETIKKNMADMQKVQILMQETQAKQTPVSSWWESSWSKNKNGDNKAH